MCHVFFLVPFRCKFGQLGPGKGQFNSPHGFCLGIDEDIVVADTNNHRVQVFEKTGEFKYQFGIPGESSKHNYSWNNLDQVTKLWLSSYLVLLSTDSKTR